jgi:hypothetical protein
MVALGELEPVAAAAHADTLHEFSKTYEFAARWTPWLEEHGVRVVTVSDPSAETLPPDRKGVFIPAFTVHNARRHHGQLRRTCTNRWKIMPLRRWLQANRNKQQVELLIGISTDESLRMTTADVKYITNVYPLIDLKFSRADCVKWLLDHSLEVPAKSACTFCPYRDTRTWREIQASKPDWDEAVAVDKAIRDANPPYQLFLHPSRFPLDSPLIDLRTPEEQGQMRLLWDEECSGLCGV